MSNRGLQLLGLAVFAVWLAIMFVPRTSLDETERRGSVVATAADGTPIVVTMLQHEMSEVIFEGGSTRSMPRMKTLTYFTPVLIAHDARTGALRWQRELGRIDSNEVQEESRVLTAEGGRVWIFASGIAAVDAATGETVADAAALEAANPALRGVVPSEGKWFERERESGRLIVTAADGRIWRVDAATLATTPTTKDYPQNISGDYLRGLQKWTAGPAIGHAPDGYTLQGDLLETQWVGLLSPEEAPRFGPLLSQPRPPSSNPPHRRRLWYADASVREGITGYTWSIENLAPVEQADEFLQGGLVRDGGRLAVLRLTDPDGFLVLHTDRLGEGGLYLLSRIDARGKTRWTASLPLRWINDLVPLGQTMALLGPDRTAQYQGEAHDILVTLDLATGRCHAWDYTKAAPLETTCAPAA